MSTAAPVPLPAVDFSEAKARLSDLMTSVVHEHQPRLIFRHRGKEAMLLMRPDDLLKALESFHFDARADVSPGEVTIVIEKLGILGFGESLEEATTDAVNELRVYAHEFFEDWAFYSKTKRAEHLPWLLRFALTPPDRQVDLLDELPPDLRQLRQAAE
ncbi:MAG: hypothetical protein HY332_05130 [Chloroflexi bacterium]|nr:hypothetical protein [Chloroflexota bacterium]